MSDMVIVNGVRYRIEDAIKLGLVEPINLEPTVVEPTEVPDGVEAEESVEVVVEPTEVPDGVEESEDGAESGVDTPAGKPGGSRRKAPRRAS